LQKEESGLLIGKDEMESGSGSEQVEEKSGNEQESEQPPKKKRYHRHTSRQIQEMEAYITPLSLILQTNYTETVNINFI
jgi:hypothetical protein